MTRRTTELLFPQLSFVVVALWLVAIQRPFLAGRKSLSWAEWNIQRIVEAF